MFRSVLTIVLGFLAGALANGLMETVGHLWYPPPPGIDLHNPEQLRSIVEKLPVGALVMVLVAWSSGALVGGLVAALSARSRPALHAIIVGGLQMLCGGVTMWLIPHPAWFVAMSICLVIPSAGLGAVIARWLRPSRQTGPRPYDMREKNMAC